MVEIASYSWNLAIRRRTSLIYSDDVFVWIHSNFSNCNFLLFMIVELLMIFPGKSQIYEHAIFLKIDKLHENL